MHIQIIYIVGTKKACLIIHYICTVNDNGTAITEPVELEMSNKICSPSMIRCEAYSSLPPFYR